MKALNTMDKYMITKTSSRLVRPVFRTMLSTTLATTLGTAALVSIHHRYRKQRHPDARLQDYLSGTGSQLQSLLLQPPKKPSPLLQLARLQAAYQQAKQAWQQSYRLPTNNAHNSSYIHSATDFSAIHTTTIVTRPVCWVSGVASMPKNIALIKDENDSINVNANANGFGVVGIDADRQLVWQTTMPERVHDIVVQPVFSHQNKAARRDVLVMGRRPSEGFWVLDSATGQVQYAIKALANRHFYGHACYSLDGKLLYVTENDTISLDGKIGIYDIRQGYQKIAEFDSYGIGPHELVMHPDGETLVIANGGIKTEQASRQELNLDTMRPSLVYLNRHNGTLLEQIFPEHNQMSVRHLAMHDEGTVMVGIQFQGEKHINVPLVLTHKRGDADFIPLTMPNNQWQRFHQYIASVAVDSETNLLCVTTPIGGCAAIYDLNTRELIDDVHLSDCAGASVLRSQTADNGKSGFMVSDGQGQLTVLYVNHVPAVTSEVIKGLERIAKDSQSHMMSFDNHLQAL